MATWMCRSEPCSDVQVARERILQAELVQRPEPDVLGKKKQKAIYLEHNVGE